MPDRSYSTLTPEQRTAKNAREETWKRENTRRIMLRFNLRTDADILARLESMENVQGYIKSLIRADIRKGEKNNE